MTVRIVCTLLAKGKSRLGPKERNALVLTVNKVTATFATSNTKMTSLNSSASTSPPIRNGVLLSYPDAVLMFVDCRGKHMRTFTDEL